MYDFVARITRKAVMPSLVALALVGFSFQGNHVVADEHDGCDTEGFDCYWDLGDPTAWLGNHASAMLSEQFPAWRDRLNDFNLVNNDGSSYTVTGADHATAFSNWSGWVNGAGQANNEALRLSRQLTGAIINVEFGGMSHLPNHHVCFEGTMQNLQDLFLLASGLIDDYPVTTVGHAPGRAEQEALRLLFNDLNSNEIPVCVKNGLECVFGLGKGRGFWGTGQGTNSYPYYAAAYPEWAEAVNSYNLVDPLGNYLPLLPLDDAEEARDMMRDWFDNDPIPQRNKARQLSWQFAAMILNVHAGLMKDYDEVYVEWNGGLVLIDELFDLASDLIADYVEDPDTADVAMMGALQDLFDDLNSNDQCVYVMP
jgi:hypothetical protein